MQETFRLDRGNGRRQYMTMATIDGARPFGIDLAGMIIHEVGGARMGDNPKTSVLNKYCQAHEVKNVFVTDGACFVTNSEKNPTLTHHGAFLAGLPSTY